MIETVFAQSAEANQALGWAFIIFLGLFIVALLALLIAAIVSVVRNSQLTTGGKVVWILICLSFSIIGPIIWFVWGRDAQLNKQPQQQEAWPTNTHPQQPQTY